MSTAIQEKKSNVVALSMSETELISVLRNSLYPGAKDESIKLVINYCKASNLDVMQKPVHIVPMSVATGKKDASGWDIKEMRDVIMPGIGLYRTQAARSGEYAGVSEPEFGDDVAEVIGGTQVTYPKWCKVTVKRLMSNGAIVEFTAKELWKENYATKSNKVDDPNAMWKKRPYAQLAKCTEAQALRKAFPEFGSQPTADEMEGKEIDVTPSPDSANQNAKAEPAILDDATFQAIAKKYRESVASGKKSIGDFVAWVESKGALMTDAQKEEVTSWTVKQPTVVEGEATTVTDEFAAAYENAEKEGE